MMPTTTEEWHAIWREESNVLGFQGTPKTPYEKMLVVLGNLDGYGIEYGFDEKDDAISLTNACTAILEDFLNDVAPPEVKVAAAFTGTFMKSEVE